MNNEYNLTANLYNNPIYNPSDEAQNNLDETNLFDIEKIDSVYVTTKPEDKRTTFDETFQERFLDEKDALDGKLFLDGLKNNKYDSALQNKNGEPKILTTGLVTDLGLTEQQYDALSCVALALASQETGMGLEKGYAEENTGIGKVVRTFLKGIHEQFFNGGSASSGLTQMKIQDFADGYAKYDPEKYKLLCDYGIVSGEGKVVDLFKNPDKAAVATMIVLSDIVSNDLKT